MAVSRGGLVARRAKHGGVGCDADGCQCGTFSADATGVQPLILGRDLNPLRSQSLYQLERRCASLAITRITTKPISATPMVRPNS